MRDEEAEIAWIRGQVDQAIADVRRDESARPAARVGVALAGLPLIMFVLGMLSLFVR